MRKILTASAAALALAGTTLSAGAADARGFHGGRGGYHGGYGGYGYRGYGGYGYGGAALGAGLLGLAVGASLAERPYYGYGYGYAPAYYGPPGAYYAPGYCRSDWRWDGYARRYVRVRYCD